MSRTIVGLTASSFVLFFAGGLVLPFLPLYIGGLGVGDPRRVVVLAGVCLGITQLVGGAVAPLWGWVGDRVGYRLMVERVLVCVCVMWLLTSMVANVTQLLLVRAAMGLLGGFMPSATALVGITVPRGQAAAAIGKLQSSQFVGAGLGPAVGGLVIARLGIRDCFVMASFLCLLSFLVVVLLCQERRGSRSPTREMSLSTAIPSAVRVPGLVILVSVVMANQSADQSLVPVLPTLVRNLNVSSMLEPPLIGWISTGGTVSAALSAIMVGRITTRRNAWKLLSIGLIMGSGLVSTVALARTPIQLLATRVALGLAVGSVLTLAYVVVGDLLPDEMKGTGYGLAASGGMLGSATSPIVSGALAALDLRMVFVMDACWYLLCGGLLIRHSFRHRPPP